MSNLEPLAPDRLRRRCGPASLGFATTDEVPDLDGMVGQERAVEAVRFGIGAHWQGYNLFALGPEGVGKRTLLRTSVAARAAGQPVPDDWCYVYDFARPHRPRALRLPAGRGYQLREEMDRLSGEVRLALPRAFEGDAYRTAREASQKQLEERRDAALSEVEAQARERSLAIVRTPLGTGVAPIRDGEPIPPDAFHALPAEEQSRITKAVQEIEGALENVVRAIQRLEREHHERVHELDRETTRGAVGHLIGDLRSHYTDLPAVLEYLAAAENDLVDNATDFLAAATHAEAGLLPRAQAASASFGRYRVNLLVDHRETHGAPVATEENPTYTNLVGRIEHIAQLGTLVTDFTLIQPGALHRANGGYLVLDARQILSQPYAWDALKRALRTRELRIEEVGQAYGLVSTVTLEPEPIPLDVKVALAGDRTLYYLLCQFDPEFLELFKIQADFNEDVERTPTTDRLLAQLLATIARRERIRPLDAGAVARVIEQAARLAGDADRLSVRIGVLRDVLREAEQSADDGGHVTLTADDVQAAIDGREHRAGRLRDEVHERIRRGTLRVETEGQRIGQVNGLTVAELGDTAFGWPTRITARVALGSGEVVDIEREVELGGPIHSKGVLILDGYLAGRYGGGLPLSLRASLVFEQSYGLVEGDSASLGELCALLSAVGEVPVRQPLAITGSVDQLGNAQAIGAVNEKIEGFYDVCAARGGSETCGVIIPRANVPHLMLREEVIRAVAEDRFHIYAVDGVDEALELLTGLPAGERDAAGHFPAQSMNGRVEARLVALAEATQEFEAAGAGARERRRVRSRSGPHRT